MIIYLIQNRLNGKEYIGQTVKSLSKRWSKHIYCRQPTAISQAIQKYGPDNFSIRVLAECDTIDDLNRLEVIHIKFFNTLCPSGYNIARGGRNHCGYKMSGEAVEKSRRGNIGKRLTEEHKEKIRSWSLAHRDQLRHTPSAETIEKVRQAHLGKKQPKDVVERRLAFLRTDRNPSYRQDVKEKIRQSKLGDKNPSKRKEVRDKISNTLKQYNKLLRESNGNFESVSVYPSKRKFTYEERHNFFVDQGHSVKNLEHLKEVSRCNVGSKRTPEQRAKISQSIKAWHAQRKSNGNF